MQECFWAEDFSTETKARGRGGGKVWRVGAQALSLPPHWGPHPRTAQDIHFRPHKCSTPRAPPASPPAPQPLRGPLLSHLLAPVRFSAPRPPASPLGRASPTSVPLAPRPSPAPPNPGAFPPSSTRCLTAGQRDLHSK